MWALLKCPQRSQASLRAFAPSVRHIHYCTYIQYIYLSKLISNRILPYILANTLILKEIRVAISAKTSQNTTLNTTLLITLSLPSFLQTSQILTKSSQKLTNHKKR